MTTKTTPKAQAFSMKELELLAQGRTTEMLARTATTTIIGKVYAEGGENALHTHVKQDHSFFVVAGEATFHDEDDKVTVLGPYEGILLPAGAYYWFQSSGEGNLVMLRFAGLLDTSGEQDDRLNLDGGLLPGDSVENKEVERIPIPGAFFGQ